MVLPILIFIWNKPKYPPSRTAHNDKPTSTAEFVMNFVKLAKDIDFWLLGFSFAFIYSVYSSLGGIVGKLIEPFGFQDEDATLFGVLFIVFGMIGSFI